MTDRPRSSLSPSELDSLLENDPSALEDVLQDLDSGQASRAISDLTQSGRLDLIEHLDSGELADLVRRLPWPQATEMVQALQPAQAAAVIQELASNDQADVLSELPAELENAILAQIAKLDPQEAEDIRLLRAYPEDVAGGLMATEMLTFPATWSVGQVIEDMRTNASTYADYEVQYAYAIDDNRALVGVLRLRDLLLAPAQEPIEALLIKDPETVLDHTPLEELARSFSRHRFLGLPVVNDANQILGVLRRSALEEALGDRSDRDYLSAQGIVGGEELRSMPTLLRARRRLSWLSLNVILNVLAASVIAFYQDTLTEVIALAVFLPIISDMSGCSGSQAVAVSVRELALGTVRPHELWRVLTKEAGVGLINGCCLGLLLALVAWLWKANPWLGAVVGISLCVNTLISVLIGGSVPLLLKRLGRDPALASGPVLTTVTDMCGFLLVLGLATLWLPRLVG